MKKLIKTRTLILLSFLLLLNLSIFAGTQIPPEIALKYAKNVLNGDVSQMDFYYCEINADANKLRDGDLLTIAVNIKKPNYYAFFVDEEPYKGWKHKCSYVFVPNELNGRTDMLVKTVRLQYDMPQKSNMDFIPINNVDRYPNNNSSLKIKVSQNIDLNSVTSNPHTYAVIISGGVSKYMNYERYWNDCSYIYQVLRNKYNVSKDNISVLISDGNDPSADMRKADFSGFVSSPLDLDNDGVSDINYSATKNNIRTVLSNLSSKLTNEDQLFIYVIDHGGYDENRSESYICLWDYETLYASELSEMLGKIKTPYINMVFGQCFSGGFVKKLEKPGRVIATACAENESSWACSDIPYDEFVFQWTNAVNGLNGVSMSPVSSDLNSNGIVSMEEAFMFARENDRRNDSETPQFSSLNHSVCDDLSLSNIPKGFSLYLKDVSEDYGHEPSTEGEFWLSPDIWVRNNDDGMINQESEPIKLAKDAVSKDVYLYMRIRNRGISAYSPDLKKQYYQIYYANAALGIRPENWLGVACDEDELVYGDKIISNSIPKAIEPDGYTIVKYKWNIPEDLIAEMKNGYLHFCLLGRISNTRGEEISRDEELLKYMSNVVASNRLAQKNMSFILTSDPNSNCIPLKIRSIADSERQYNIELAPIAGAKNIFDEAEIGIGLSADAYTNWEKSGKNGTNCKTYDGKPNIIFMENEGTINSLLLKNTDELNIACHFKKQNISLATDTFKLNVIQRDVETGKIVGGEAIYIIRKSRGQVINPGIGVIDGVYDKKLTATNINEPVSYEWIDNNNKIIGTEKTLMLTDDNSDKITLRVTADSDGALAYATVDLNEFVRIKSINPLPLTSVLNVSLDSSARSGMKLVLSSSVGLMNKVELNLKEGEREFSIPTGKIAKGEYVLSLYDNGKVIDSRHIVKE